MKAVIGSPETPTPTGHFFIVEKVPQPNGSSIGPWALALNGYSNVLHQFGGGPGQIAIHGIGNLGASPGEAASHGCIRLTTANLDWLARRVSSGVTVAISGPSAVTAKASYMPAEPATVSLTIKSAENNMAENIFSNPFSPFFSTD